MVQTMNFTEIIESFRQKINVSSGRHLYGVLGGYARLDAFAKTLCQAKTLDGVPFPNPTSVNAGILRSIPDADFRRLAEDEAKYPEPTAAHVRRAFEVFLRATLLENKLVVFSDLEMLFAYNVEMSPLRTLAADDKKVLLLLPGKRSGGRIVMFHESEEGGYTLPTNLIADNHLWEIRSR